MLRKSATVSVSVLVIIFLPVTLFALALPLNDYRADGMTVPAECDGPAAVMLLIGPSLVVYIAGVVYYTTLLKRQRSSVFTNMLLIFCVVMMAAAGSKTWAAYREQSKPGYQRTCVEG